MRSKKVVSVLLAGALSVSVLAGCGGGQKPADKGALPAAKTAATAEELGWKADTEPVTLDWYINYSWYSSLWDAGEYSQYIQSKTGVKANFIIPAGNEAEKLNTMIVGDTLPDMITIEATDPALSQMVEAGLLYSINELADLYDPAFYNVASAQTMAWFAQKDGKTYGYPNASIAPEDFDKVKKTAYTTFNVKADYYEAIGSPDMSTPEGFLDALIKAKEQFPTIDGQPLIPLGLHSFTDIGNYSLDDYLLNYLGVPMEKDGKLYDRREDANYQAWLKTFRKANELGLIADDVFMDDRPQMEEKIAQGRYFAMLYQSCDFAAAQQMWYSQSPDLAYKAIQGPSSGNAPTMAGPSISGWTVTCITKNCKDPERAIEFMTYLISEEGTQDSIFGEVGKSCEVDATGTPHLTKEYQDLYNTDFEAYTNKTGSDPLWMLADPVLSANWYPDAPEFLQQMYRWSDPYIVSGSQYENINPPTGSPEAEIKADIDLLWGATLPQLIRAGSDEEFDSLMQAYITSRDEAGYASLLEYQQARFEENKKKLGI